jgi:RNA-directed DNA polymerase
VWAFEAQAEAEGCYRGLGQRLGKGGLALSAEKMRVIPFRRHRPGTPALRGSGSSVAGAKIGPDKIIAGAEPRARSGATALKRFTAWCKENRHLRLRVLFVRLNVKLRGYYNYYGGHGNAASLKEFFGGAMRILPKGLNRRSQRRRYRWCSYPELLARFAIARPRIVGRPRTRATPSPASAHLRKRVSLKRPVRENRTPGSVRGPPGTWRSYRDGR